MKEVQRRKEKPKTPQEKFDDSCNTFPDAVMVYNDGGDSSIVSIAKGIHVNGVKCGTSLKAEVGYKRLITCVESALVAAYMKGDLKTIQELASMVTGYNDRLQLARTIKDTTGRELSVAETNHEYLRLRVEEESSNKVYDESTKKNKTSAS